MTPARPDPDLVPDDHVVVVVGATGDLARRKLLPGLYHLAEAGLLPRRYRIVGTSPVPLSTEEFRARAREAVDRFGERDPDEAGWAGFAPNLRYVTSGEGSMADLAAAVEAARGELGGARLLHYLAIPPAAFTGVVAGLGAAGLAGPGVRVIVEKPFGSDLASAKALNALLASVFGDEDVYLIDHFLGKEDVQNILVARFANGLLEPTWNREHLDHVQIDVPETLGVAGRGAFYEGVGAFRDMVVTHLLQVLGFVAMERPRSFTPGDLAAAKQAVFDDLLPIDPSRVVRGQYVGYRQEPGVAPDSDTETFVSLEVQVDNDRWRDVPFFLRTGKRMPQSRRVVTLVFQRRRHRLFKGDHHPDTIAFEIAEPGGITVDFLAKVPGARTRLGGAEMTFRYDTSFALQHGLEAYERLLHDAMLGDRTLFNRASAIERLWEAAEPLLAAPPPLLPYEPGTWGPPQASELLGDRAWHLPLGDARVPQRIRSAPA